MENLRILPKSSNSSNITTFFNCLLKNIGQYQPLGPRYYMIALEIRTKFLAI
jgi:hypothetical protein